MLSWTGHVWTFLHPILISRATYWAQLEMHLEQAPMVVLNMWPCKNIFSHASLVLYFLVTPPTKLETRTSNRWGTTNNKPPGPISTMGQSETLNSSQVLFITLFLCRCTASLLGLLQATAHGAIILSEAKPVYFSVLFIQFQCAWSHTQHRWRCSKRISKGFVTGHWIVGG